MMSVKFYVLFILFNWQMLWDMYEQNQSLVIIIFFSVLVNDLHTTKYIKIGFDREREKKLCYAMSTMH